VESEANVDSGQKAWSADGITINLNFGTFSSDIETDHVFKLTSGPLNGQETAVLARTASTVLTAQGTGFGTGFAEADWEVVDRDFTPDDEYRSDLRIVDDGALNKTLVKRVLRLMRAAGERWNVTFLDFLDLFQAGCGWRTRATTRRPSPSCQAPTSGPSTSSPPG
jgi:hypothetical protein